jgi:hypothetical protein
MSRCKNSIKKMVITPRIINFIIGFVIFILFVVTVMSIIGTFSSVWNPFARSGYIIGNFRSAEHDGFGDFCGQYPYTRIVLDNWSISGDYDGWGNRFYFGNQYKDVDELVEGQIVKIYYSERSRPSDATSGGTIFYWVITNIEVL